MPNLSPMLRIAVFTLIVITYIALGAAPLHASAAMQQATSGLAATGQNGDTVLEWPVGVTAATAVDNLPIVRHQGYELPMQLVTLALDDTSASLALQVEKLDAVAWTEPLAPAAPLVPPALDWSARPRVKPEEAPALPGSPAFVLRQGRIHGQMIAVVAISPLYQENGQVKLARHLVVRAAKTRLAPDAAPALLSTSRVDTAVRPSSVPAANIAPANSAASENAIKVIVHKPGIQQISGEALAGAGLDLASVDPAKLRLMHNGAPIPLALSGLVGERLALTSEVRFYVPEAGDRWNTTSIYWLVVAATDGERMGVREVAPVGAPTRTDAIEEGVWNDRRLYVSQLAGVDGDHWFHTEFTHDPTNSSITDIPFGNLLPPATGSTTITLTFSTLTDKTTPPVQTNYHLQVHTGLQTHDLTWNSTPDRNTLEDWSHTISTLSGSTALTLSMVTIGEHNSLFVDQLSWRQPAVLDFAEQGAQFSGVEGVWTYQLQNPPDGFTLYDVTDPLAPVILTGVTADSFQDGPAPRRYLLSGPGLLHQPTLQAHTPVVFGATDGADAIYIAPKAFISALTPLVEHRRSQGYVVKVVDVQDIYDAWSYGHISAEAIRTFLRFAAANWDPKPISVVLVGDATWDPHNYENKAHFTNYIPPYVAYVDPWLGEAACENCFAQLDGDDPVVGDNVPGASGTFFKTDLWIGRFPVRNVGELTNLVNKIIRYETDPSLGAWRSTAIFLADNYILRIDANNNPHADPAGDFARISDAIIKADPASAYSGLPPAARVGRVYYDPYPAVSDPDGQEPWRIKDAETAKFTALSSLSAGAGVVVYNGHSHHWQWARLDPEDFGLVNLYDPDTLTNKGRPFIALSMTCLTSQFHKPADSGTVLDERMILNPSGGAIAVWGPAGLSVVHGHDALQRGFFQALWEAPPMQARLGELLEAGYTELLVREPSSQDAAQTFLLLGDPLTPARIALVETVYLPQVSR